MKKSLLAALLLAAVSLTACDKKAPASAEDILAQAQARQAEQRKEIRTFFSNTAELHKALASLADRPELQGAQFGPVSVVTFDIHRANIEVIVRSSKAEKLAGYDYPLATKKWSDPQPVRVSQGKDKDLQPTKQWPDVKPDVGMALRKADETLATLPPETVGYIYRVQFDSSTNYYKVDTTHDGDPKVKNYSMTLDANGQIVKKNW